MSNRGASSAAFPRVRALSAPTVKGSAGFAAVLSFLLPGLGQMYLGRWIRGALMILIPIFTVVLAGAFIAIADPLTSFVLRHAAEVTFLVASAFFLYHLFVVADAFAGKLRGMGSLRGRHVVDPHMRRPPSGVLSVTITGPDLATADAYATAAFAMGAERGPHWTARLRGYEAMTILADGRVLSTPGFPGTEGFESG